jgi:hypothetical protein
MTRKTASATTSEMDFCDLIASMEQAEISPRPVVGAIIVASGLAMSFLPGCCTCTMLRLISPSAGCSCRPSTRF